jgi:predicted alpha/beta-fold hydrolase
VQNIKTIRAFDDAYVAPMFGFASSADYYAKSSARQFLKDIETKTLIIHALDDPFMSSDILPNEEELSSSITLEVSPNGGHVGFVAGSFREPVYWLDDRIVEFFG